jgi:hypothetical protein
MNDLSLILFEQAKDAGLETDVFNKKLINVLFSASLKDNSRGKTPR